MKAVILERRGTEAAVLAEDGAFIKVPCSGEIGEEIDIAKNVTPMPGFAQRLMRGLAAAALILVAAGGVYHYTAVSVSAYISVDAGGSSFEMKVNRLGQIISVESVNDDDSALAETISGEARGMRVEDAVGKALDTLAENGKLSDENEPVIVGITSETEHEAESIENAVAQRVELPVYTVRVSEQDREEAHRQETGGGRYVYDREETANELPENNAVETENDMISLFVPITEEESIDNENAAAGETDDPETEQQPNEENTEIKEEENNVQPPEPTDTAVDSENAPPPELPDNGNASVVVPPQNERNEKPVPQQEQRPQATDTEISGEMPQNGEAAPPQPITENDKQNGEAAPQPPETGGQPGEQPVPPDNNEQPPEMSGTPPAEVVPPDAEAAGQQPPDGQMPPMPAPMDGQPDMMPSDRQ